jgi:chemotaxis protein CheX
MSVMCNIVAETFCLGIKDRKQIIPGDISGIIGFVGDLNGLIAVTFPKHLACACVSNMINDDIIEIDEDVKDGIREITNIIAGNAKSTFKTRGLDLAMTLPSVIVGEQHQISTPVGIQSILVGFKTNIGSFWLEVGLKEEN